MNTQATKIVPLLLLIFFGSAQAELVNGNVDAFSNESIIRVPTVTGNQSFLNDTAFVSKATDSNDLNIKHSTTSVKATALNSGVIIANDLSQKRGYFNENRFADKDSLVRMTSTSRQSSGISDFLMPTARFIEEIVFFPFQNWQATVGVLISSIESYNVNIDNILVASSSAIGDLGIIIKKAIILSLPSASLIPPVSLTITVWLFGAALMGFLAYCKRKYAI